jgi:hypothetical protein
MSFYGIRPSLEMALIPERYRRVDPDGAMNKGFVDEETAEGKRHSIRKSIMDV